VVYDLLFKASAETTLTIAADPEHLGARIGFISVLHTWGSALVHHPHVHMIVPGGGFSPDGSKWIACRPRYFLTVEVLSALFRRLFLEMLAAAHVIPGFVTLGAETGRVRYIDRILKDRRYRKHRPQGFLLHCRTASCLISFSS
jgi:hypothetical protein